MVQYERACFVVMPFGTKEVDGRAIDFDSIFHKVFVPAIEAVTLPEGGTLQARRTDQDFNSGDITVAMFQYLEYSRFVLADITGLNANVLYELGVRHRARQSGTAIFRQTDVKLPFDIAHIKAFPYEYQPEARAGESRALIGRVLRESLVEDQTDNIIRLAIARQEQRPRPEVDELRRSAENALRHNDPAKAVEFLRQAVQADLQDVLTPVKLGIVLKENGGNWAEAASLFSRATKDAPGYADAWRELGIAQGKLGHSDEAEKCLRKAIELNPTDFDAFASLGGILKREGNIRAAAENYRQAVRVSGGHSYPLLNALTLEAHLRGRLDTADDELPLTRAERSLRLQIRDDPPYNAPWSFFDLAQVCLFRGDQPGFLENIKKGISFSGSSFMPRTFYQTLDLLPREESLTPAIEQGIAQLRKAEEQLRRTESAGAS